MQKFPKQSKNFSLYKQKYFELFAVDELDLHLPRKERVKVASSSLKA